MNQLKSLITIQKLAENLRGFEIGPTDDFFLSRVYLELSRDTSTRKLYANELQ